MEENKEFREDIKDMTEEELSELQKAIRYEKQKKYSKKGIQFCGYIDEKYKDILPLVMDYLMDTGVITKKTMYNFSSMAVREVINTVIVEIRKGGKTKSMP